MNTLTLFEAYVKVRNIRDFFAGEEIKPKYEPRHERLFRQQLAFSDAIRARLTPPRKRVVQVTMDDYPRSSGYTFASIRRTHDDLGSGYFVSPSSHGRLLGVCRAHMTQNIGTGLAGVAVFSREVTR